MIKTIIETFIPLAGYLCFGSVLASPLLFLVPQNKNERRSSIATIILFNGIALNSLLIIVIIAIILSTYI